MTTHFSILQLSLGICGFIAITYIYVKNIRNELS